MGRRIRVRGEPQEHEEDKRIQALKSEAGFPEDDVVVYDPGDGNVPISDRDEVGDIPEDATVASQPDKGRLFG
jgi:hypothetical protein